MELRKGLPVKRQLERLSNSPAMELAPRENATTVTKTGNNIERKGIPPEPIYGKLGLTSRDTFRQGACLLLLTGHEKELNED